jgi:hypothetical protein
MFTVSFEPKTGNEPIVIKFKTAITMGQKKIKELYIPQPTANDYSVLKLLNKKLSKCYAVFAEYQRKVAIDIPIERILERQEYAKKLQSEAQNTTPATDKDSTNNQLYAENSLKDFEECIATTDVYEEIKEFVYNEIIKEKIYYKNFDNENKDELFDVEFINYDINLRSMFEDFLPIKYLVFFSQSFRILKQK